MPGVVEHDGQRLPATYVNFYFINGALLVPTIQAPEERSNGLGDPPETSAPAQSHRHRLRRAHLGPGRDSLPDASSSRSFEISRDSLMKISSIRGIDFRLTIRIRLAYSQRMTITEREKNSQMATTHRFADEDQRKRQRLGHERCCQSCGCHVPAPTQQRRHGRGWLNRRPTRLDARRFRPAVWHPQLGPRLFLRQRRRPCHRPSPRRIRPAVDRSEKAGRRAARARHPAPLLIRFTDILKHRVGQHSPGFRQRHHRA